MHLPLGLLPPLFSLTIPKQYYNKTETSQRSFLNENKRMYGWNPQKPQHFHTISTSCATMHTKLFTCT